MGKYISVFKKNTAQKVGTTTCLLHQTSKSRKSDATHFH